jgi:hypothetical protein
VLVVGDILEILRSNDCLVAFAVTGVASLDLGSMICDRKKEKVTESCFYPSLAVIVSQSSAC